MLHQCYTSAAPVLHSSATLVLHQCCTSAAPVLHQCCTSACQPVKRAATPLTGGGGHARAGDVRAVRHREEHIILQVSPAAPLPALPLHTDPGGLAPVGLHWGALWGALWGATGYTGGLLWKALRLAHARTQREGRTGERNRLSLPHQEREGERSVRQGTERNSGSTEGRGRDSASPPPCHSLPAIYTPFRFVAIQKRSSSRAGGKPSAAMVLQVKGLAYVTDPSMQHLL